MDAKIRIVTKIISDTINAKGFWISESTGNVILINNGVKLTVEYISENESIKPLAPRKSEGYAVTPIRAKEILLHMVEERR